jgi:hypothetical protein
MANENLHKSLPVVFAGVILILVAQGVVVGATFTVTNTGDDAPGSLRQAIEIANANVGPDVIAFNIPGAGPHTIQPIWPLPEITSPVVIDGYTQPGTALATDNSPATLLIELDGINLIRLRHESGLAISAGNSTVRGLVINRFGDAGIRIYRNGGNTIEGNFIGTDVTGTQAQGNLGHGVYIETSPDNMVGGSTPEARNVISDNDYSGVEIFLWDAIGNQVQGNYIGTDATGTTSLGNTTYGVIIRTGASETTIGPDNLIQGNDTGIWIDSAIFNTVYRNNFIDNITHAYAAGDSRGNVFNLDKPIGGNYWSGWTLPDAQCDGFVDLPYTFTYGADYLPWDRQDGWLGARPEPRDPAPMDGDVRTETWVILSWSPVCEAKSRNVYFGTNFNDVAAGTGGTLMGNQIETSLIIGFPGFAYPAGLVPGTTYYWRIEEIDELNPASPWSGDVWSFKVADSLSGPLDTALTFTTGGDAIWFSQTAMSYYGGAAAQSGAISRSENSWMQTIVNGEGTISFYWKVSSEMDFDFLEFYIDGFLESQISELVDWEQKTYTINRSGMHVLKWQYIKDGSTDFGSDSGWVDKVEWVPIP